MIALVWANTAAESYFIFAHRLSFAVNEIGMAFFFALLAQEVAEAVMPGGALHTWRRWTLAVVAAIGGMVGAVAVFLGYVHLNFVEVLVPAWPIACAIDAAVTYYVLKTIMPRSGAVPFALLVALVTDGIALVIVGAHVPRRSRRASAARRSCSPHSAWRRPCALLKVRRSGRISSSAARCRGWRSTGRDCIRRSR